MNMKLCQYKQLMSKKYLMLLETWLESNKIIEVMLFSTSEIILNQTRTPNLQELFLHNVPDDCRIEILLPTLKKFKMFYYQG